MKKIWITLLLLTVIQITVNGCGQRNRIETVSDGAEEGTVTEGETLQESREVITVDAEVQELEEGLSAVRYDGNYGFEEFLSRGGAATDSEVVSWLAERMLSDNTDISFAGSTFGCSTLSIQNAGGGYLFGRNFDWNECDAMIVSSRPDSGYASVSTVNMDFVQAGGMSISELPGKVQAMIGLYAPLDGMNEKGLAISVNMIEDSDTIEQDTGKPDLTTTTAIRLLLNQAADVEDALKLLGEYDLHASMGMMIHFAIADARGNSVAVEYVDNKMVVTHTPVVTNFYFAEGEKYGIGTSQSHMRYDILYQELKSAGVMGEEEARDAMDSVSKDDFNEFESTEWTIIMNQETKELTYYHRENYQTGYTFAIS